MADRDPVSERQERRSVAGEPPLAGSVVGEVPLQLLTGFPETQKWPEDARIGPLSATRLSADAQTRAVLREARDFFAVLLGGSVDEAVQHFYDAFAAESFVSGIQESCLDVRVGIPERLPQGEWSVPFRCLGETGPAPVQGRLFVARKGEMEVVDGVVAEAEPLDEISPEERRENRIPF